MVQRPDKRTYENDKVENNFRNKRKKKPVRRGPRPVTDEEQAFAYRNMDLGLEPHSTLDIQVNSESVISGVRSGMQDLISRLENQ